MSSLSLTSTISKNNKCYDAIVIGLGSVGSFALRALSKDSDAAGGHFLGIERYTIQPTTRPAGSYGGKTRIYRRAYFEHEHYVPWIDYSISSFQQLERSSGLSLLQQCGSIIMEDTVSLSNDKDLPPYVAASLKSAQLHNVDVEYYDANSLPERFPQFHFNKDHKVVGVYEPGGGFVRPELAIQAALNDARNPMNGSSVDIVDQCIVTKISNVKENSTYDSSQPIEVTLCHDDGNEDVVQTKSLLVSAGSWTSQLIPEWSKHLNVIRQVQTWLDVGDSTEADLFSSNNMPAFVYCSPDFPQHAFYGIPCDTNGPSSVSTQTWLKLGLHKQSGYDVDLNINPCRNKENASVDEITEMQYAVARGINSLAWNDNRAHDNKLLLPEFVYTQPCMYTMSPDKHYIIGTPEGYRKDSVFVIAGLSGHGFKCAPALGQMMSDFSLSKDLNKWRTQFCSPQRFNI